MSTDTTGGESRARIRKLTPIAREHRYKERLDGDGFCCVCGARRSDARHTEERRTAAFPVTFAALQMSDADKLRALAELFDQFDDERRYLGAREVQADLRRIADKIEAK